MGSGPAFAARQLSLISGHHDGALILECRGRLNLAVAQDLEGVVKERLPSAGQITLDRSGGTPLDSSGRGAVVSWYASARGSGCRFELYHLTDPVKQRFGLTKILGAFEPCGAYLASLPEPPDHGSNHRPMSGLAEIPELTQ